MKCRKFCAHFLLFVTTLQGDRKRRPSPLSSTRGMPSARSLDDARRGSLRRLPSRVRKFNTEHHDASASSVARGRLDSDRQPEGPLATCSGRHWHSASASCQCQWSGASLPVTALCLPVRCQPASEGRSGPLADPVRSLPVRAGQGLPVRAGQGHWQTPEVPATCSDPPPIPLNPQ